MLSELWEYPFDTPLYQIPYEIRAQITEVLEQVKTEHDDIKIESRMENFFPFAQSKYMLIALQALSKNITSPLKQLFQITAEKGNIIRNTRDMLTSHPGATNASYITISTLTTARTNFYSKGFKDLLQDRNYINSTPLNDSLQKRTEGRVLGAVYNAAHRNCIFILNSHVTNIDLLIMFAVLVAFLKPIIRSNDVQATTLIDRLIDISAMKEPALCCPAIQTAIKTYATESGDYTADFTAQLTSMLTQTSKKRLQTYETSISKTRSQIQNQLTILGDLQASLENDLAIYTTLFEKANKDTEQLVKDFNEMISLLKPIKRWWIVQERLHLLVVQPTYINYPDSWDYIKNSARDPQITKFLTKLFIDEDFIVENYAHIVLNFERHNVFCVRDRADSAYISRYTEHAIPNPHLVGYNCFGAHSKLIAEHILKGDIVAAVEQSITAGSEINWSDGPVMTKLFQYIREYWEKPIVYIDNTYKTPKEVMELYETNE